MGYQEMLLDLIRYSLEQNLSMGEENLKEDFRKHIEVYCDLFEAYCLKLQHSLKEPIYYQAILDMQKELKEYRERIHYENIKLLSQGYKHKDLEDSLDGIFSIIMKNDNYLSDLFAETWVSTDLSREHYKKEFQEWEAVVCSVDSIELGNIYRSTKYNVSCSLISSRNHAFYNGRKIGLLYNVMNNNQCEALAMYNGDLKVSIPDKVVPLTEYLKSFYKEIGTDKYNCWPHRELELTKSYPFCLPNSDDYKTNKFFHKVLPLHVMRETLFEEQLPGQALNEIVILGSQKPYGVIVHGEDFESTKPQLRAMCTLDTSLKIYTIENDILCRVDVI